MIISSNKKDRKEFPQKVSAVTLLTSLGVVLSDCFDDNMAGLKKTLTIDMNSTDHDALNQDKWVDFTSLQIRHPGRYLSDPVKANLTELMVFRDGNMVAIGG